MVQWCAACGVRCKVNGHCAWCADNSPAAARARLDRGDSSLSARLALGWSPVDETPRADIDARPDERGQWAEYVDDDGRVIREFVPSRPPSSMTGPGERTSH